MDLSKDDYAKILEYYKLNPKSYQKDKLQKKAEELLATKLCRCIKNVRKDSKNKFTEQEAHQQLRSLSMDSNQTMQLAAQSVLTILGKNN